MCRVNKKNIIIGETFRYMWVDVLDRFLDQLDCSVTAHFM